MVNHFCVQKYSQMLPSQITFAAEVSEYIVEQLSGLDTLLLESNHDLRMLEVGRYPYYLKQRIASNRGHLSNETAGQDRKSVV